MDVIDKVRTALMYSVDAFPPLTGTFIDDFPVRSREEGTVSCGRCQTLYETVPLPAFISGIHSPASLFQQPVTNSYLNFFIISTAAFF